MRRLLLSAHCRSISRTSDGAGKDDAAAPVDIKEQSGAYEYVLDVPGLRARDLKVKLVPDRVLQDADLGRVSAVCRDGVLRVTVLKLPPPGPVEIPRTIDVMP
ncbi:17.0 kDa class II heat shock protein-like [Aegilops tauschii subsp. strangulata]|uniref:17.0 kDa class II heat shock protein-like n=1 Tax=Aegilops tauschii subsp. strangulata TaxID=200361 RepID=UPI000989B4A3|nr:17.5 kDa class II heat shock protein-like [Aegilops tauschii subsp. strangulata]